MATVLQIQIRCAGCNRRLADLVNEVEMGQVLVEMKCPRCGHSNLEVIRSPRASRVEKLNVRTRASKSSAENRT